MCDKHKPMTEEEIARDERLCSANETLIEMLESTEPVDINDRLAAGKDLADFRRNYDTGWPRALAEVRRQGKEIARLRNALEVATVTMASVWPEHFRAFFSDDEIQAMLDRTNPEKDFKVEELIYKALTSKGA